MPTTKHQCWRCGDIQRTNKALLEHIHSVHYREDPPWIGQQRKTTRPAPDFSQVEARVAGWSWRYVELQPNEDGDTYRGSPWSGWEVFKDGEFAFRHEAFPGVLAEIEAREKEHDNEGAEENAEEEAYRDPRVL